MSDEKPDLLAVYDQVNTALDKLPKPKKGAVQRGTLPCPMCGSGTISYIIAGPRAMRAKCSTAGCIVLLS